MCVLFKVVDEFSESLTDFEVLTLIVTGLKLFLDLIVLFNNFFKIALKSLIQNERKKKTMLRILK